MFFDTIIFDLDDTLYDSGICNKEGFAKVVELMNYKGNFRMMYNDITKKYKLETGNTAASHNRFNYIKWIKEYLKLDFSLTKANDLFWETYYSNMQLFEGVLDFLKFLKNNNIKIGMLTDFQTEYQYRKLEKLGILEYFDVIVTSEEMGIEKPSVKGFQYLLKKLGSTPEKTIMMGDSVERDIVGAQNVGIYPMWFSKPTDYTYQVSFDNGYGQGKMGVFSSFVDLLKAFESIKRDTNTLKWLSQDLGQRFDLTQAAGGNISVKNEHFMIIKSSGVNLYDVTENNGYSFIKNNMATDVCNGIYKDVSEYNVIIDKKASMETYMHSYLKKYTIHLHPIEVNKVLIRKDAKDIIYGKILPKIRFRSEYVPFINYVKPGVDLSKKIYENIRKEEYMDHVIFLENHGLILSSDSLLALLDLLKNLIKAFEEFNETTDSFKYKNTSVISKAMYIFEKEDYISYLVEDEIINKNIKKLDFGSTFPDKVIYCGIDIFKYDGDVTDLKEIDIRLKFHNIKNKPVVFLLGDNIYITAKSMQRCREIESVLKAHFMVKNNNTNYLSMDNELDLLNMEEEKYRQNVYSTQN